MLFNCLFFLCIGVYASCMPMLERVRISIWEIQKDFCKIEKPLYNHLTNLKEIPLDIPKYTEKGACARFNLNTYIKLLNQSFVNITQENVTTHYNKMFKRLTLLAGIWLGEDMICPTTKLSNLKLTENFAKFLLQALPANVCLNRTSCPPKLSMNESCFSRTE